MTTKKMVKFIVKGAGEVVGLGGYRKLVMRPPRKDPDIGDYFLSVGNHLNRATKENIRREHALR